jgi:serine/threonine-protein kinase HipA
MRRGEVYLRDRRAGMLTETETGSYRFVYDPTYLLDGPAISVTLPLRVEPYESATLFPFFAGLVPEGWYLRIVARTVRVDESDTFGLLLATCEDCIGAVGVRRVGDDPA